MMLEHLFGFGDRNIIDAVMAAAVYDGIWNDGCGRIDAA